MPGSYDDDPTPAPGADAPTGLAEPRRGSRLTYTDRVYQTIRQKVIDAEFIPGTQILEHDLAAMLGVSRTPVREALIRLQQEGLVEVIPRHGVRIAPMSVVAMREIYELLGNLERAAAEILARNGSSVAVDELSEACVRMEELTVEGDMVKWCLVDEAYHLKVVQLCGNSRLAAAVMNCWDQVHRSRIITLRVQPIPDPRRSIREHYDLIEAVRTGDVEAAGNAARDHRERGSRAQIRALEMFQGVIS